MGPSPIQYWTPLSEWTRVNSHSIQVLLRLKLLIPNLKDRHRHRNTITIRKALMPITAPKTPGPQPTHTAGNTHPSIIIHIRHLHCTSSSLRDIFLWQSFFSLTPGHKTDWSSDIQRRNNPMSHNQKTYQDSLSSMDTNNCSTSQRPGVSPRFKTLQCTMYTFSAASIRNRNCPSPITSQRRQSTIEIAPTSDHHCNLAPPIVLAT